ncbi:hypothetical protein ABPG77_000098 [Micractinium sp. CCAP 211/92]
MSNPRRRGLLPQLSGSLGRSGAAATAGSSLDPALRAELTRRASSGAAGSFAAQASLAGAGQPEATLAMFRRLNAEQEACQAAARGGKETPQDASLHGVRGPGSDSAWHTEAEAEEVGSPGSQASSMQATSWGGGVQSAFAPAAARQFSGLPDSSRSASPLPRSPGPAGQALHGAQGSQLRAELLRQLPSAQAGPCPALSDGSSRSSTVGSAFYSAGGGTGTAASGLGTPRSTVSWCSALALPQTESELAQLDLEDVRQLAAEAEALQQRAALALRLARLRMHSGQGSGRGGGDEGRATDVGGGGSDAAAEGACGGLPGTAPQRAPSEVPQMQGPRQQEQPLPQQQLPYFPLGQLERGQHEQDPKPEHHGDLLGPAGAQAEEWEPEDWAQQQPQQPQQPALGQQERQKEQEAATHGAMASAAAAGVALAGVAQAAGCGGGVAGRGATAGMSGSTKAAPTRGVPASSLPEPLLVVLQLVVLAAAALEAVLLWVAGVVERTSGGMLRAPRALVRAPPAAVRGGVMVAALLLELLACLARVLHGQTPA